MADDAGVQPGSAFAVTSRTSESAVALARRIMATPATELAVDATSDPARALIAPAAPLAAGQLYRFDLRAPDGTPSGSWAFRVRGPLQVLSTLPGDRTTNVPTRTGIEITFDQDGAADIGPQFSISPAVAGRFERHGRTQAFVPDSLQPATLYTVSVRAGLARTGTDLKLESDVVFAFETAGTAPPEATLRIGRDVIESSPREPPLLGVEFPYSANGALPAPVDVTLFRIGSERDAVRAMSQFLAAPRWSLYSTPRLDTSGLATAASFTAPVEATGSVEGRGVIRFPEALPVGWYVVELAGPHPAQALLQVTAVSAWTAVLVDRTVVWVNDVTRGGPIAGATVEIIGHAPFGTTDVDGLVNVVTPPDLLPAEGCTHRPDAAPLLVVRAPDGGAVLVSFDVSTDHGVYGLAWDPPDDVYGITCMTAMLPYWSLLGTDRTLYRTTDTVRAWGYLQARRGGAIPGTVELRLVAEATSGVASTPALAREAGSPDAAGAFTAEIPIVDATPGWYTLEVLVDGRVAVSRTLEIGVIRKPAYQLGVVADHRAVISGTPVRFTITAAFFDGSPVPQLPLRGTFNGQAISLTTDAAGVAVVDRTLTSDGDVGYPQLDVYPAVGEAGGIWASGSIVVFPSSDRIQARAGLDGSTLAVTGTLHAVDLAKAEAKIAADGWYDDADGAPIAGRSIQLSVTDLVPHRRQVGTWYDFVAKVTVPRYEVTIERRPVGTSSVVSDGEGAFASSIRVPDPSHSYEVVVTSTDAAGRVERHRTLGAGPSVESEPDPAIRFERTADDDWTNGSYQAGGQISLRLFRGEDAAPQGGGNRYLYLTAQQGLVQVRTSTEPTFDRTFAPGDTPSIDILGVRFTGQTYLGPATWTARLDQSTRNVGVTIAAERPRYQPGDDLTLAIRTTDASGQPVSASVVVQAVDEKLYAMRAANVVDPLSDLYGALSSGIARLGFTHAVPSSSVTGQGDTTGGDGGSPRSDFRDTLAQRLVKTDAAGLASLTVRLSDDLTSWHVSAIALTRDLRAGTGELIVPVGLSLFADVTVADSYLVTDQPAIRLRAFGSALQPGEPVEFTVSARSLGLDATVVSGTAFSPVSFPLPALSIGRHEVQVAVTAAGRLDADGRPVRDAVVTDFDVVASRVTVSQHWFGTVGEPLPAVPSSASATYTLSDAGRSRYLGYLLEAAADGGARLDDAVGRQVARDALVRAFGMDRATWPREDLSEYRFASDGSQGSPRGLPLLPYASPDPALAARIATLAPGTFARADQVTVLRQIVDAPTTKRDLQIAALAGLAALGEPVLADLVDARAIGDLTVPERTYVGLGFAAIGDLATAAAVERALLRELGRRMGPWVRLESGVTADEISERTALLAVLAAFVGDPLTPSILDYVDTHPSLEAANWLELAVAAARLADATPAASVAFSYTVDGRREEVTLKPGASVTFVLTPAQRATLSLETRSGSVGVAVSWRQPVDLATLPGDPALVLRREVSNPMAVQARGGVIVVRLSVAFGPTAARGGCYVVTEHVPSGLAPLPGPWSQTKGVEVTWPTSVVGQEVQFCVENRPDHLVVPLRYAARVVTTGTYTWEPAVLQRGLDVASAAQSEAGTLNVTE